MISRLVAGERGSVLWGFIDQTCSSATNFGLTVISGRELGPAGLGTVFIGFSVYLIAVAVQRALLIEPLISSSSSLPPDDRKRISRFAVTMSITFAVLATLVVMTFGMILPGSAGRGFLIIAPWIGVAIIQDVWRDVLFRDARPSSAALNDATWLVIMALAIPFATSLATDWAFTGAWGCGALAGMALGFGQTRVAPSRLRDSWDWWQRDAMSFGKWNAGSALVSSIGGNATAFILTAIVGPAELGGFRASQSIFAPITLIIPAISLPGLPSVARALKTSSDEARRRGAMLSGIGVAAALGYMVVLLAGVWRLLPLIFGQDFARYRELIWPTAAAQTFTAAGIGLVLLLKAERRGHALLTIRSAGTVANLFFIVMLTLRFGVLGAAWGGAAGALVSLGLLWWSSSTPHARRARQTLID